MSPVTKTLNPLHFEDLEPHRFEDLIRQLAYDFRDWASLEAIGRAGSDEGMDIRGIEASVADQTTLEDEDDSSDEEQGTPLQTGQSEKVWLIQCKREKTLGPKRIRGIISEGPSAASDKPYGYIIAAPCNFSLAARNAFKEAARAIGIQEFYLWGKGEIEDRLVLPKNDHLLFAYFGVSLQIQRRTARSLTRSRLAAKRRLIKILGELRQPHFLAVLLRDPSNEAYPSIRDHSSFAELPQWRYWWFHSHQPPDHVAFVFRRHYAYVNWETKEWDAIGQFDAGIPPYPRLHGLPHEWRDPIELGSIVDAYWNRNVPEANRAWALELRAIHYDRILAIDELGDAYNEGPHLLVAFFAPHEPFEPTTYYLLESARSHWSNALRPGDGTQIGFFPTDIPDEREVYRRELQERLGA